MTVVEDFAADYFVTEGLTAVRQRQVTRALRLLSEHAGRPPEQVDDQAVRAWIAAQLTDGLHVNTVRKQLYAVKPFYKWCWRERVIDADTWLRIKDVSPPRGSSANGRPRPYSRKEIARFWLELDETWPLSTPRLVSRYARGMSRYNKVWRHAMHMQTQAVVSLALFGGLRQSEIRMAPIDAIHPDNEYIVVRGKSAFGELQGYREVPYTEEGRELIGRWLEFRALIAPAHENPWLVLDYRAHANCNFGASHPSNTISYDGFKRIARIVGHGWELHRFRHTCATEWLRAGVELERVSELLGHSNITQTLAYAKIVKDDVARSMRRGEADFVAAVGRRHAQLLPGGR